MTSTERHVVVVGSGAAGTAATIAARAAGANVTLVSGRTGATSLTSGAVDGTLDDASESRRPASGGSVDASESRRPASGGSVDTRAVASALELHALGPCALATSAGTIRKASGRDLALLDLDAVKGPVLVARVAHVAWDADALAAAFAELDPRGFVVRDVGLVLHTDERAMGHVELAARHDEPARLARAAERIQDALGAGGQLGAVLLPPWLGCAAPRARELSALAAIPCGEVLVPIDGPAGIRFERARDRWLQNANITTRAGRVTRIRTGERITVTLDAGEPIEADAVVLATGGVLAGGITYTPGDAASFALSYDAPVALGLNGRPLVIPGSLFGVPPESLAWPTGDGLERVGIVPTSAPKSVFVCGDCVEGAERTLVAALSSGARAGRAAGHFEP